MKKRGASEYITKEHGTVENRDSAADPPKMSTAAQLARRKIATPKSRTGRSTTPTMSSNPFQSQSQPSSTFQFGSNATQSFPPPTQGSQSFNFTVPSASSSFTFGQSDPNQPQNISNPFANLNGANGGFGNHQTDNTEMQDSTPSQAQPVQPVSLFNFSSSQPAPSANTNGFSFGQSSQQQSNGGFGSNIFGQQNNQNQSSNTGLFGQSSQSQSNGFGSLFGGAKKEPVSSSFTPPTTSSAPAFTGFGSSSTSGPPATSAPAATFKFGQTSTTPANSTPSDNTSDQPKRLFDFGSPQPEQEPTPKKPSFTFGQPSPTPNQSEPKQTPSPAFAGFGQPVGGQPSTNTTNSNIFSGFGTAKPTETPNKQTSSSVFGQPKGAAEEAPAQDDYSSEADQAPKNPFSSLFGGAGTKSDTTNESTKLSKTPFQFGQSTSSAPQTKDSTPISSQTTKSADQSASQADSMNRSSLFNFSKPANSNEGTAKTTPATPSSNASLFNLNKPTPSTQPEPAVSSSQETPATQKPLFSFTPQKPSGTPSAGTSNLFQFGNKSTNTSSFGDKATSDASEDQSPPKKRLFQGTSTPNMMAQSAFASLPGQPTLSITPADAGTINTKAPSPTKPETVQEPLSRAVSTEGPPQIPRFLSGEKYKVYDESWRLKALNRQFKNVISGVDIEKHDFMNIVQNYLDHREAIGEGLGGYERKKAAGTKRKAIDVDDLQEEAQDTGNKRTKPAEAVNPPAPTSKPLFTPSLTPSKPAPSFTPVKSAADTQTSSIFKSMIPGAANSNTTASPAAVFSTTKSTTPPSSPPKPAAPSLPKFEVPKFGGGGGASSFMNAFAKNSAANAKKFEQEAREKRKAEEFDSDEDDEDAWNKKYEEEQKAKKAKIEAAARASLAVPAFIPSASSSRSNSPFTFGQPIKSIEVGSRSPELAAQHDSSTTKSSVIEIESGDDSTSQESGNSGDDEAEHADEDEQPEEQEEQEESEDEAEEIPNIPPEESLFSRVTGGPNAKKSDEPILQPAVNNSFKPSIMFGNIGKSTPEQPTFSPFTPSTSNPLPKGDFVPTTKFNFTPATAASSNSLFGSSMLGGSLKDGPIPGEGLFGSRPSTPSNADAGKSNPFSFGSSTSKQPADNTYKQGTPIKFGTGNNEFSAPSLEVTAATPPGKDQSKPFAGLFGQSSSSSSTTAPSLGFNFGTPSTSTQPAPGFLSAAAYLGGASGPSSRATSPGLLSEAESVATDNTEDYSQEPQTSLMSSNSGEENDQILYEAKAAISRMYKENEIPEKSKIEKGWNKMGTGVIKVLKDKTTDKTRILFRAEPGANVILNTRLIAGGSYKSQATGKNGVVTFPVATDDGMQTWMIRVKTLESAQEAAKAMEANKKS